MTFNLTLSGADLLLLVPEMLLTVWLCVVLIVDFAMPRLRKEHLAYLSVGGLGGVLACLLWFDLAGISGTLFAHMFVVDGLALFCNRFFVGAKIIGILARLDYVRRFRLFKRAYYFLLPML